MATLGKPSGYVVGSSPGVVQDPPDYACCLCSGYFTRVNWRIINAIADKSLCAHSFLGESMDPESTMAYAYYREGAASPTFLFCKYALDGVKC